MGVNVNLDEDVDVNFSSSIEEIWVVKGELKIESCSGTFSGSCW